MPGPRPAGSASPLGYYRGDDEHGLAKAADAFVARLEVAAGAPLERAAFRGDELDPARLAERIGTAPLFGGGTVVIITDASALVRSNVVRDATIALLGAVAPGNGLLFVDAAETGHRETAGAKALRDAVAALGGDLVEIRAPSERRMAAWIEEQARDRDIRLGPGAAEELASRVGAMVKEADVDRRRMSALASTELDKLGLYRAGSRVERDDVRALVSDALEASGWAFLDAVGERNARHASELLDRLLVTTPEPVLLAQLHRRVRELIVANDLVTSGASAPEIVRALKIASYPAELRARQARRWRFEELQAALEGLLDLDAMVKGADPATPRQVALAFQLWVRDRVAPARSVDARSAPTTAGRR
ncbi:MAG TPA: DNA polymerase III subunit delta [Candidatus Limnocylindrales bacterium]|nr:DNA polymerase III subunit delta [Candidatus Limnocylindrales bacterium]